MRKFEKLMLLPAAAALSAFLTVGCEKKNTDAAEPAQPTEEVKDESADPAQPDSDAAAAAGDSEHPTEAAEEKTDHPTGDHPN